MATTLQTDVLLQAEQEQVNTLPKGDTIVVRRRTPEPQGEVDDRDQILSLSPEPLQEPSPDASEAPIERQSRSGRPLRLPQKFQAQQAVTDTATPTTYNEATSGPQKRQWETAIAEELTSLASNNVWILVERPQGVNIVSTKWVFKIKRLPNGQIDKYKARVIARGFTQ